MIIDFLIGLTLVNALPHFVLGIWKGRMLSIFGFTPNANLAYGLLNAFISVFLFLYQYGWEGWKQSPMYIGGLFVVVSYLLVGKLTYTHFHKKVMEKRGENPQ